MREGMESVTVFIGAKELRQIYKKHRRAQAMKKIRVPITDGPGGAVEVDRHVLWSLDGGVVLAIDLTQGERLAAYLTDEQAMDVANALNNAIHAADDEKDAVRAAHVAKKYCDAMKLPEIKSLRSQATRHEAIAKLYGVSVRTIHRWKHIALGQLQTWGDFIEITKP